MRKEIQITQEESQTVYKLFSTYNAYLNILGYLADRKTLNNTEVFDKKWDEAILLCRSLDETKANLEKKYKPEGEWDHFEFNFETEQIIFTKDEK